MSTSGTRVPKAVRGIEPAWRSLLSAHGTGSTFDPSMAANLPDGARRWVTHSIEPGTPMARGVQLTMHGTILLRSWRPFTATQLLVPGEGFIWAATARVAGVPVSGFDRYTDAEGEMRWRLAGAIPVMSAHGPDVTRSAAGRLVSESILVPTTFGQATWTQPSDETVGMTWTLPDGEIETATLTLAATGELTQVRIQRWGDPFQKGCRRYGFVVDVSEQRSFDGIMIPTRIQARWEDENTGDRFEFFRARITNAVYG